MDSKRILVVEDEFITAQDLKFELVKLGYEVPDIAVSGEEALCKAAEFKPDLILMDITLDGPMTGIDAAEKIRTTLNIPTTYLTAHIDSATIDQAKKTNPYGYLPKPCTADTLKTTIEIALYMSEADAQRRKAEAALCELNAKLEQRVAEETALRLEKELLLMQQAKMAAMGEMIGAIAHQWRQPLNALGLLIQATQDAYEFGELNKESLAKFVDDGMKQIRFMSKTIDDFRNFFKQDKLPVLFDVKAAMAEVLALMSWQLKVNNIAYRLTCKEHNRTFENFTEIMHCCEMAMYGFKNELEQVILNIISNAKDALVQKHKEDRSHNGLIKIEIERSGDKIIIAISDNGGGIPENSLDKIFQPYFTTKKEGTGIGLYMAKMIVEGNMGGSISAHNNGGGPEFKIALPTG
ncbi:MAG: response regulator [Nitrospirae bacterium]|nr:response regulator [Nitrospirota bacterium]